LKKLIIALWLSVAVLLVVASGRPLRPVMTPVSHDRPCINGDYDPTLTFPAFISKPTPRYTAEAVEHGIHGVIKLNVTVHKTGKVDVTGMENRLGYGLDEEAIRVANAARFKPGTSHGHPVEFGYELYVDFRLPQQMAKR
jgi:TonB family protein